MRGPTEKTSAGKKKKTTRERLAEVVAQLLGKMEQQLQGDNVKTSVADYIRLMQLHKELEEAEPREIRVRWVDPEETKESETGE